MDQHGTRSVSFLPRIGVCGILFHQFDRVGGGQQWRGSFFYHVVCYFYLVRDQRAVMFTGCVYRPPYSYHIASTNQQTQQIHPEAANYPPGSNFLYDRRFCTFRRHFYGVLFYLGQHMAASVLFALWYIDHGAVLASNHLRWSQCGRDIFPLVGEELIWSKNNFNW